MPKTRGLILCLLIGLLIIVAPEPNDTIAVKTFGRAEELATESMAAQSPGEPGRAAQEAYEHVSTRRPLDPLPWRQLGALYQSWGNLDETHYAYGQTILRGDRGCTLDKNLAQLEIDLGNLRRSIRLWDQYLARCPDDHNARLTLAQTAIRLADWERARAEFVHILARNPNDSTAHAWLGLLLIGPEPDTGRQHLQHAANNPAMADWLNPILDAERLSIASQDPAYRSALLGIALLDLDGEGALAQATSTLALRSLLAAVYLNPSYADAYAYLGQAFDHLGWPEWALASLQYAQRLAPQSPIVLTLTGLYWDRRNAHALARQHYELAYKQDPNNATLSLEIAATYAAEGNYTAAEIWLLIAIQLAPNNPQTWETLAHFYVDSRIGIQESGLAAVNRLLELAPDNAIAHDMAGWAYFLTAKDEQAEANLNQALTLDPTLASAHYHLGQLYARQGRYVDAAWAYQRANDYDLTGQLGLELDRAWKNLPQAFHKQP